MLSDTPAARTRLPTWLQLSDVQGFAQLATQATLGVTHMAETVQGRVYQRIAAVFGPLAAGWVDRGPDQTGVRAKGITGLVYGSVKGVTRLVGGTANAVLARAAPLQSKRASPPAREAMLAALNGVLGDHLRATANPLLIGMELRQGGKALVLEPAALAQRLPNANASGKVLVLVHGLSMNDLQWRGRAAHATATHDHGAFLADALGYTPVYVRYNTGLSIAENGRLLNEQLAQLWLAWPVPITTLTLLTHSMGGLVSRSACYHAEQSAQSWRQGLRHLVFLGTPHGGAPLEALGHWLERLLSSQAVTRPFAAIGKIRSRGIHDLREGKVLDAENVGAASALPLPSGVACFALAASTTREPTATPTPLATRLSHHYIGDGLVPVHSALGTHPEAEQSLHFAPERQRVVWHTGHIAMLYSAEVAAQLRTWLDDGAESAKNTQAVKTTA